MDRMRDFDRALSRAAREMAGEEGTPGTLERALRMVTEMMHNCDFAGISLVHPDGIDTPYATNETLREIDQMQYQIQEGPCFDALRQVDHVVSTDLSTDARWPRYGARLADRLGIHSSVSYRLFTTGDNLGALNLYSRKLAAFDGDDIFEGMALAAHASVALAGALREEQLQRAISTRTIIGQATGILMERFQIDAHRAFAVLVRASMSQNVKLHHVARALVATRHTPE